MNMTKNPTIRCKEATLEFIGENSKGGIEFEFTNLITGTKETLDFNLGLWDSYIHLIQRSGVYIFRPKAG